MESDATAVTASSSSDPSDSDSQSTADGSSGLPSAGGAPGALGSPSASDAAAGPSEEGQPPDASDPAEALQQCPTFWDNFDAFRSTNTLSIHQVGTYDGDAAVLESTGTRLSLQVGEEEFWIENDGGLLPTFELSQTVGLTVYIEEAFGDSSNTVVITNPDGDLAFLHVRHTVAMLNALLTEWFALDASPADLCDGGNDCVRRVHQSLEFSNGLVLRPFETGRLAPDGDDGRSFYVALYGADTSEVVDGCEVRSQRPAGAYVDLFLSDTPSP